MNDINKKSIGLEKKVLAGITFIRDYIQFLFEGPTLNIYTSPLIIHENSFLKINNKGYYDMLCSLVGKEISLSFEDKFNEWLSLVFVDGTEVRISLKEEDRECVEAAMLRMEPDGSWFVW